MGLNCTGKSFSEACNICRTCCIPKLFWMSKQIKNSNLCTQHVLQVSELTIFMNKEQSVVILWVSWCKNKSFWQRFTCTRLFSFKNDWHIFCTFYMIMRWFHTLSHQFLFGPCNFCHILTDWPYNIIIMVTLFDKTIPVDLKHFCKYNIQKVHRLIIYKTFLFV